MHAHAHQTQFPLCIGRSILIGAPFLIGAIARVGSAGSATLMSSLARKFRIKFDDQNLVFDETYPLGMEQYLSEPEFEAVLRKINEELNQDAVAIRKEVHMWGGITAATAIFVVGLILSPVLYVKLKRQERIMTQFRKDVKEHLTESTKLLLRSGKKLMRWELVSNKKGNRGRDVVNPLYDMAIEFQVKRAARVAGGRKVQQQQEEEEVEEEEEEEEEPTTSYSTPNEPSSAEAGSETSDVLGELPSEVETSGSSAALFANTGRHNPKRVSFVGDTEESSGGGTSGGSARGNRRRLRKIAGLTAGTAAAAALLNKRRRERQNMSDEEDAGRRESAVSMASVLLVDKRASTDSVESVPLVEDEKRASTGSVQSMEIGERGAKTASMMPISFADKRASTMTTSSIATVPAAGPEAMDTSRMSMLSITALALGGAGAAAGLATVNERSEEEEIPASYGTVPIVNAAPSPTFPNADAISHPSKYADKEEEKALSDIIEETEEEEEMEEYHYSPFIPLGAAGLGGAGAFAAYQSHDDNDDEHREGAEKKSFEEEQKPFEEVEEEKESSEEEKSSVEEKNSFEEEQEYLQQQQQQEQEDEEDEDPFKDQPQDEVNSYEQDSSSVTSSTSRGDSDSISTWTAFLSSSAAGFSTQTEDDDDESLKSIQQSLSEADSGSIGSYPSEQYGSDESSLRETYPHSQSNSGTDFWGADSDGDTSSSGVL